MTHVGAVIADLVTKWNLNSYIMLRIRVLMGFLIFMYYIVLALSGVVILSIRRPWVSILDVVSETLLVYILGAMQAAPFRNKMFPVWALCLVSYRTSVNFLSKFDMSFETVNMVKLSAVVLVGLKHGSDFGRIPFWIIWCALVLKSLYRFMAHFRASKHLWYGPSSELLERYMSRNSKDFDPHTMVGCDYLVYGEQESSDDHRLLITVGKVWQLLGGRLECRIRTRDPNKLRNKHLVMAFALSRLLRCRVEGAKLNSIRMTRKLFCSMLEAVPQSETEPEAVRVGIAEEENVERAREVFGILVMELLLLTQHLHSGYPVVFCLGLPSYLFHLGLFALRFVSLMWIGKGLSRLRLIKSESIADMSITAAALFMMLCLDGVELLRYLTSTWTRLLLVCKYVSCSSRCLRFLLNFMISDGSGLYPEMLMIRLICRDEVLLSSTYTSGKLKPFNSKLGLPKRFVLSRQKSTELVMAALIQALAGHIKDRRPRVCVPVNQELQIQFVEDSEGCLRLPPALIQELVPHMVSDLDCLPGGVGIRRRAASASDRTGPYWSAFLQLQSCSQVILVWHIATSLCAIDLAKVNATNLLPENENLEKDYTVATILSRYCLHLLISKPMFLPENIFASKTVLLDTIESARVMLEGCVSWEGKYAKLLPHEAARAGQDTQDIRSDGNMSEEGASDRQDIRLDGNILEQGAILAKELINEEKDKETRWQILAEVWTHLLVHIAPSSDAESHGKSLTSGAELITIVWALLTHCGIEKSSLWPESAQVGGTLLEHLKGNAAIVRVDNSAPPA